MSKPLDITGKTFGNLKAIRSTGEKSGTSYIWEFECLLCGKITKKRLSSVTSGKVVSCGCYKNRNLKTKPIEEKLGQKYGTNISRIKSDKIQKNNTSGHKGVSLHKQKGKSDRWIAYIYFQGVKYHLGSFVRKEDAIQVRKDAEKELFGDFLIWYKNIR